MSRSDPCAAVTRLCSLAVAYPRKPCLGERRHKCAHTPPTSRALARPSANVKDRREPDAVIVAANCPGQQVIVFIVVTAVGGSSVPVLPPNLPTRARRHRQATRPPPPRPARPRHALNHPAHLHRRARVGERNQPVPLPRRQPVPRALHLHPQRLHGGGGDAGGCGGAAPVATTLCVRRAAAAAAFTTTTIPAVIAHINDHARHIALAATASAVVVQVNHPARRATATTATNAAPLLRPHLAPRHGAP